MTVDKTGDVAVSARYENANTFIFGGTDNSVDDGWSKAQSFTSNQNDKVYIRVIPFARNASFSGTYAVVYSTTDTRPDN